MFANVKTSLLGGTQMSVYVGGGGNTKMGYLNESSPVRHWGVNAP